MTITAAQLHILRHAQGLDQYGQGTRYRNHYCTGPGADSWFDCCALVEAGLMKSSGAGEWLGGMTTFSVTEAGDQVARELSPKLSPKAPRAKRDYRTGGRCHATGCGWWLGTQTERTGGLCASCLDDGACSKPPDGKHCRCWWDGDKRCCLCGWETGR